MIAVTMDPDLLARFAEIALLEVAAIAYLIAWGMRQDRMEREAKEAGDAPPEP